jgi:hypothetical protein
MLLNDLSEVHNITALRTTFCTMTDAQFLQQFLFGRQTNAASPVQRARCGYFALQKVEVVKPENIFPQAVKKKRLRLLYE